MEEAPIFSTHRLDSVWTLKTAQALHLVAWLPILHLRKRKRRRRKMRTVNKS